MTEHPSTLYLGAGFGCKQHNGITVNEWVPTVFRSKKLPNGGSVRWSVVRVLTFDVSPSKDVTRDTHTHTHTNTHTHTQVINICITVIGHPGTPCCSRGLRHITGHDTGSVEIFYADLNGRYSLDACSIAVCEQRASNLLSGVNYTVPVELFEKKNSIVAKSRILYKSDTFNYSNRIMHVHSSFISKLHSWLYTFDF